MQILWGSLMAAAGLFMLTCGTTKSEFIIYRLMVARSRILWGEESFTDRSLTLPLPANWTTAPG